MPLLIAFTVGNNDPHGGSLSVHVFAPFAVRALNGSGRTAQAAFSAIHAKWAEELQETTKHRFRRWDDVLMPYMHHYYVMHEGSKCCGFQFEVLTFPTAIYMNNFEYFLVHLMLICHPCLTPTCCRPQADRSAVQDEGTLSISYSEKQLHSEFRGL